MRQAVFGRNSTEDIIHFSLQGLIEPEQSLALDINLGFIALLTSVNGQARILQSQQLTPAEIDVLLPLLESYPYYCPYDFLLASMSGRPNEKTIARCRERLQEAMDAGIWDMEIRPIRNVLSRTRIKIRSLGIDIKSIIETGYMLGCFQRELPRS